MLHSKSQLALLAATLLISPLGMAADPIKSGMTLWLDASDINADGVIDTFSDGDKVSIWKDKSGQKNDVKLAPGTQNPITKKGTFGNEIKPVVYFGGAAALVTSDDDQITANTSYTKFVIFKVDDKNGTAKNNIAKHNLIASTPFSTSLHADNAQLGSRHVGGKTDYLNPKKDLSTANYHIAATRYSKPDDKKTPDKAIGNILKLDGKRVSRNDDDASHVKAKTTIGAAAAIGKPKEPINFFLTGKIAEALIYDRSLSNAEIITIEKYLAEKWSLKLGQSIAFDQPKNQVVKNPAIQLNAIASSGLAVKFTSTTKSICKITNGGKYVTLDATGTCKINANQAGDDTYPKASLITRTFEIKLKADDSTEAPADNSSSGGGSSGGSPLPIGLAILGFIALLRRKLLAK